MDGHWGRVIVVGMLVGSLACSRGEEGSRARPDPTDRPSTGTEEPTVTRVLSGDESFPDGFTVPEGEVWALDPDATTTVVSEANVVVEGVLRMRPGDADVVHTLRFAHIDEAAFVGGGMDVVAADVGLWVVGDGQLDLVGTERAGWSRTRTDPTWQGSDEIRVAPVVPGDTGTFPVLRPGAAVPSVSHAGVAYDAEAFNLTRNVRIEGTGEGGADPTRNGRAHIWIHSTRPQTIRYASLRHLGPRRRNATGGGTEGVLGRYALHFHMSGDGSRGSVVEGVVVRDAGNHAFVPHASHGVTLRDTIAFDVFEDAYWWDPDTTGPNEPAVNATDDVVIEHALAALIRSDAPRPHDDPLSGFTLGEGSNTSITDSAAVGLQGAATAGFHWPASASATPDNVWDFSNGNIAHNNDGDGIFVWQNDENDHVITDFVGFHNGAFGIEHGAALNTYRYEDLVLFANGTAGIRSVAGASGRPQEWLDVDTDGIVIAPHTIAATEPIVFRNLTVEGPILVDEPPTSRPALYEFQNATTPTGPLTRVAFDLRQTQSHITVQGPTTSFDLSPRE